MQKGISLFMILAGCSGLGFWYSTQFQKQFITLQAFCSMLELYLGQIRFTRCSLPECCLQLAERAQEPYGQIFRNIYEEACANSGESFGNICERYLTEGLKTAVCQKKDKEIFISCFSKGGFEEDVLQLRHIEQARAELEDRMVRTAGENASKCRLALSLGTMGGLLLVLLFI